MNNHKKTFMLFCLLICPVLASCTKEVQPIPKDKQSFIGRWNSEVGIAIKIFPQGTANILRLNLMAGSDKLDINASDPTNFRVYFPDDTTLLLIQPLNIAREYKIDKYPYLDSNQYKIVLNGVTLVKEYSY